MPEKNGNSAELELEKFIPAKKVEGPKSLEDLSPEEIERFREVGVDPEETNRLGTFIQADCQVLSCHCEMPEGVELLPITEALRKYDWLARDYLWKAVPPDKDVFTKITAEDLDNGYFIRIRAGEKVIYPLQACLYIRTDQVAQRVHNIVIVEEGAELHIITGCTTGPHVVSGLHIGVSEFYIKKGGKLTYTMIHEWGEGVHVRPRTGIWVEEKGVMISNYISLDKVGSIKAFPVCRLKGPEAVGQFNSVVAAPQGSFLDLGSRVILEAPKTRAEIISRTVCYGGEVIARGHLIGQAPEIKAHLECQGLMLSDEGYIIAIPELEAHHSNVDMSHEAAVGKIAREEIEYLMARGLTEEEATSLVVRGFLNVRIEGLPPELQERIDKAIEECRKGM
ncbi:MAG: SufD family Fe-S cluster assembly protein [Thermodesulfobacteria bacterium]|nr:SufD family Fe-S cluster assembly protein [Thermodesulfobacteriota bacterium]